MANAFAMIDESLWRRDRDFRALPRHAQCTFLQVLSQRDVDCAGILTLHLDLLAKGCDEITIDDVSRDLKTLETRRFIYADDDTDELLIRSYARRVSARSPNALKAALKAAKTVSSPKLRHVLATELRRLDRADATTIADQIDPGPPAGQNPSEPPTEGIPEPIRTPSERGNPSERDTEPPSCSSVVDAAAPTVGSYLGGATPKTPPPQTTEEPPRRCPKHADTDDPPLCGNCAEARRANDKWNLTHRKAELAAANQAAAARRADEAIARATAIDNCTICDPDGYHGTTICNHNPHQAQTNTRGIAAVKAALAKDPIDQPDDEPETPENDTPNPDEPPY